MSLWSELKRRNVVRVAAAYLVASWVLIEVASIMFDAFAFPPFALKLLIAILGLGLLPMIIFSWAYELTAEGLMRDPGPGHANPQHQHTARRLDQVTIAMILVALAVVVVQRFVMPERVVTTKQAQVDRAAQQLPQPVTASAASPARVPGGPSVAVLPFTNMSPDPENAFFADGISEEILNVLASIDGLKVASRTSAFSFRDGKTPIRHIAAQLGVQNVLEGSVRRQGDTVRITAQLIDAGTDAHLWSGSYNRELDDVFAVQEEIANSITAALGKELGLNAVSVRRPTEDLKAYEQFLLGRSLFYQRGPALIGARAALEDAVARDPDFAEAWAYLSAVYQVTWSYQNARDPKLDAANYSELTVAAAERARKLDDSLALPYAVLGLKKADQKRLLEAEELLSAAVVRDPNDSTARLWLGIFYLSVGHIRSAQAELTRANEIDPLVGINISKLALTYAIQGDTERAYQMMEQALSYGFNEAQAYLMALDIANGDLDKATSRGREFTALSDDKDWVAAFGLMTDVIKDPSRGKDFYELVVENPEITRKYNYFIGELAMVGQTEYALQLAANSESKLTVSFSDYAEYWFPMIRQITTDPRFLKFVDQRTGLKEYWDAKAYPDNCELVKTPEPHLECSW